MKGKPDCDSEVDVKDYKFGDFNGVRDSVTSASDHLWSIPLIFVWTRSFLEFESSEAFSWSLFSWLIITIESQQLSK